MTTSALATAPGARTSLRFRDEGMDCASRAAKIETAVHGLPGVSQVNVTFTTGALMVEANPAVLSSQTIENEVVTLGYQPSRIEPVAAAPPLVLLPYPGANGRTIARQTADRRQPSWPADSAMSKRLQILALLVLIALGAVAAYLALTAPRMVTGPYPDARNGNALKSLGKPMDSRFDLVDHRGERVGPDTFAGRVRLVFFGFTHCPDVCPTGLSLMSQLLEELGADAKDVQALFVSVDPERDTVEVLSQYITVFAGDIRGLTGTPAQIAAVTQAFNAYFKKVPQPSGGYTVDHTASVYLLDRDGTFRGTVDIHESQEVALKKIRRVLASGRS